MQFKTKLGLVDIPNDEVMAASRDIAGSATSTPEIAAPSGSLSTGDLFASALSLLALAKCPNCDGSGATMRAGHGPEYVSRDMAMDAGDPTLEGSIYREAEPIIEQCQWCAERDALLANGAAQTRRA